MKNRVGLVAVGCCLILVMNGCGFTRPRHGLILRGDWSLEMNRIPWIAQRNLDYQQPVTGDCIESGVCGETPPQGEACAVPCGEAASCAPRGRCKAGPKMQDACVDYLNHPRFHPVPTKPVFSPREPGSLSPVPTKDALTEPELIAPPAEVPNPSPKVPVAPVPPPEKAPIEPGELNQGDQSSVPRRLDTISGSPSWIFTPPPLLKLDPESMASRGVTRK